MTILALATASQFISDPQFLNGVGAPILASTGTALVGGNTGFTFPWAPGILLYFVGATGNTVTLTLVNPNGGGPTTAALTATVAYLFGPISSTFANGATGLVSVNVTGTITGSRAGVFLLPSVTGALHNPMDMGVSGVSDY